MCEAAVALAAALWPLAVSAETDWLRELADDDGFTGFMPPAMPDAAWVLHFMYEHELGPFGMSYVDYRRAFLNSKSGGSKMRHCQILWTDPTARWPVDQASGLR
ncbi:hypothetical protein [Streptomyces sp. NPDC096339]|uniref:hypothetical protein n=1 Tax=Streptomyces sp. NPDC096339 TaxID=3366086 RepID=UPI00382D1C00